MTPSGGPDWGLIHDGLRGRGRGWVPTCCSRGGDTGCAGAHIRLRRPSSALPGVPRGLLSIPHPQHSPGPPPFHAQIVAFTAPSRVSGRQPTALWEPRVVSASPGHVSDVSLLA